MIESVQMVTPSGSNAGSFFQRVEPAIILRYTLTLRPSIDCHWIERPNFREMAVASLSAVANETCTPLSALPRVFVSVPACLAISFLLHPHAIRYSSRVILFTSCLQRISEKYLHCQGYVEILLLIFVLPSKLQPSSSTFPWN